VRLSLRHPRLRRGPLTVALALVPLVPLAGCGACEPSSTSPSDGGDGATAAFTAPTIPVATGVFAPDASAHRRWDDVKPPATRLPCRAMDVRGGVLREGVAASADDAGAGDGGSAAILSLAELPRAGWLRLETGARLVAKDPRTTRETNFEGPGRVRPCVAAEEETWVASGAVASSPGQGEAPGAEEWVVTPLAVVRYATGAVRVEAGAHDVTVTVATGTSWAWLPAGVTFAAKPLGDAGPAPGASADGGGGVVEGWQRIEGVVAHLRARTRPTAASAVKACAALAQTAHDDAAAVMAGDAAPSLVTSQVVERRVARAACAFAQMLLEMGPGPTDPDLARTASSADSAWRALPL